MKKKRFTKMLALFLAMVMVFAVPMEAYAAKKVTAGKSLKKAKAVKTGKQTVVLKLGSGTENKKAKGYLKFTATKTKTYKFTVNNLQNSEDVGEPSLYLGFMNKKKENVSFKYKGKKGTTMWLGDTAGVSSMTVSIKLKKGTVIYIYFLGNRGSYDEDSNKIETGNVVFDLKIK